jgi:hypothetical protein
VSGDSTACGSAPAHPAASVVTGLSCTRIVLAGGRAALSQ